MIFSWRTAAGFEEEISFDLLVEEQIACEKQIVRRFSSASLSGRGCAIVIRIYFEVWGMRRIDICLEGGESGRWPGSRLDEN